MRVPSPYARLIVGKRHCRILTVDNTNYNTTGRDFTTKSYSFNVNRCKPEPSTFITYKLGLSPPNLRKANFLPSGDQTTFCTQISCFKTLRFEPSAFIKQIEFGLSPARQIKAMRCASGDQTPLYLVASFRDLLAPSAFTTQILGKLLLCLFRL